MRIGPRVRAGLCAACLVLAADAGARDGASLGVAFEHNRGDYGRGLATSISAVSLSLQATRGKWRFGASLPWLRVSGNPEVLPSLGPLGLPALGTTEPVAARRAASGVGDLGLSVKHVVASAPAYAVEVGATAKIATADEARGLGTGAHDVGLTMDARRAIGELVLFAGAGHEWLGDSPSVAAGTQRRVRVGMAHPVGPGDAALSFERRTALAEGLANREDAAVSYGVPAGDEGRVRVTAYRGLSDSSPDWGAGVSLSIGL